MDDISLLYSISRSLNENPDLKKSLETVLDLLGTSRNTVWGAVSILDPLRNEINI
ncbi:MAG: AAA family ATPase, partial [Deltaproteobacteria bacterium]|nr:AAA family ATPase [Deltaproteobacteria bacterium]